MSETTTATEAPNLRLHPADVLMCLLATLLAPMFVCATAGDIVLARMAAIETINDYRTRNHADLIAVAQIIGYGLAALGSLSLSMADDISLSMTLRLRGNANACTRSAEHNRRAIRQSRDDDPIHNPAATPEIHESWFTSPEADFQPEFETFLSPDAERLLAAETKARLWAPQPIRPQAPIAASTPAWQVPENSDPRTQAIAMVKQALKIDAGIPNLPPAERAEAVLRVAELNSIANQLLTANGLSPPSFGGLESPSGHL
jgi:hypothetical protein